MLEQAVLNVFQPGLIRGGANLKFDPEKKYAYVEHPTEGWRVYLRSCCFVHSSPASGEPIDYARFIVVKTAGKGAREKAWEPPKGQCEYKDLAKHPKKHLMNILKENVTREVAEESRIQHLQHLCHSGLVFQGREPDYPPNHFFQYHIFHALVSEKEWMRASAELDWYRAHPLAFSRLRRDKREKDALDWYSPSDHKLMGRWSPKIVAMYLNRFDKH
jgi:hypothetical protein